MTQTGWKLSVHPSTSRDVGGAATLAFLTLALCLGSQPAHAREDLSGPLLSVPTEASAARDLAIEVHVRTALKEDEQLRTLNLRIKVSSGIAQLSGPVPSAEVRRRVVEVVERVPGVLRVQSAELYLARARKPAKPLPLPLEGEKPTQTRSASPGTLSSAVGTLTGRDPLAPARPKPNTAVPQTITLLAPEAVTAPPRGPEPTRLTAHPRPPATPSLSATIDRLRQGDARFRTIRTEVTGATVRLIVGDTPGEHVMAFAQAITRLPGVQRVVVKDSSSGAR